MRDWLIRAGWLLLLALDIGVMIGLVMLIIRLLFTP